MAANIPSSMRFSVPTIQEGSFLFLDHGFVPLQRMFGVFLWACQFGDIVKAMNTQSDRLGSSVLLIRAHCSEPLFPHDIPIQNCVSGCFAGICSR